jgi:hypothetical protein
MRVRLAAYAFIIHLHLSPTIDLAIIPIRANVVICMTLQGGLGDFFMDIERLMGGSMMTF